MSDSQTPPAPDGSAGPAPAGGAPQADQAQPQIVLVAQYVKDLSFENPNAPASLDRSIQPNIQVGVDVQAGRQEGGRYEVSLRISANAKREETTIFVVELLYCGLFELTNMAADTVRAFCLVEGPRLLFPFARRVIADATRDGGFPGLLLDPIDFAALYRRQLQEQAAGANPSLQNPSGPQTPPS